MRKTTKNIGNHITKEEGVVMTGEEDGYQGEYSSKYQPLAKDQERRRSTEDDNRREREVDNQSEVEQKIIYISHLDDRPEDNQPENLANRNEQGARGGSSENGQGGGQPASKNQIGNHANLNRNNPELYSDDEYGPMGWRRERI